MPEILTRILKSARLEGLKRFLKTNSSRIAPVAIAPLILIFGIYTVTTKHDDSLFRSQFRIIYSLDKRQNDQEIVRLIDNTHRYAYFAMYTFTLEDVADALIRAKDRGVAVQGITDSEQATSSAEAFILQKLQAAGISVITQKHQDGIMHVKALVTDQAYAIGSYNWTEAATDANDEILEIGTDHALHDQYLSIVKKILLANQ